MSVKLPALGAGLVGAFAVVSYALSTPNPDTGVIVGIAAAAALVIIVVLLVGRYANRDRIKP